MAESQPGNPYAAVSVRPCESGACAAAKNISGQRLLCNEAPLLPLKDCDRQSQCGCRYDKWEDRRQEDRRTVVAGMGSQVFQDEKRSLRRGRRSTD